MKGGKNRGENASLKLAWQAALAGRVKPELPTANAAGSGALANWQTGGLQLLAALPFPVETEVLTSKLDYTHKGIHEGPTGDPQGGHKGGPSGLRTSIFVHKRGWNAGERKKNEISQRLSPSVPDSSEEKASRKDFLSQSDSGRGRQQRGIWCSRLGERRLSLLPQ